LNVIFWPEHTVLLAEAVQVQLVKKFALGILPQNPSPKK
jgi:hypothetical protein